jgi:ribulose-5-phosphate 4-epimerase/fuculose-1-phosphate aldolase
VSASRALAAAGLSNMVWGHAAIRDPDGRGVWMKASGWGFEEVKADRVLLVSPDGDLFSDPPVPRFTKTGGLIATAELGAALADALGRAPACLMPSHEVKLKREQVWNDGQRQAGWQYLVRAAGRMFPS